MKKHIALAVIASLLAGPAFAKKPIVIIEKTWYENLIAYLNPIVIIERPK